MAKTAQQLHEKLGQQLVDQYDNVIATGYGTKQTEGKSTGEPALILFVQDKKDPGEICRQSADQLLPDKIDGVKVDVIATGDLTKMATAVGYKSRIRPIAPGYSIGHPAVSAGTLGGLFLDKDGDLVALSNCHVLANENRARTGDPIYQPGAADSGGRLTPFQGWVDPLDRLSYFATLKAFVPLSAATSNHQDSAVAVIPSRYVSAGLVSPNYPMGGPATGFGEAQPGMQVQKFGRTTGRTEGKVLARGARFTIPYDIGKVTFEDCIVTTYMSRPGDSGSILYDMEMRALGLLFAGSDKVTLFNPVQYVQQQYGLRPWAPGEPAPLQLWGQSWKRCYMGMHTIQPTPQELILEAHCNQHAYLETKLEQPLQQISLDVFSGSDTGASWGPGIVLTDQQGQLLKLNLRTGNQSYGGYWNGEVVGIGRVQPNSRYRLRVSWNQRQAVADICELSTGRWSRVLAAPGFGRQGLICRIGKTDVYGGAGDHPDPGLPGRCHLSGWQLKT